jgi:hypothetical protein
VIRYVEWVIGYRFEANAPVNTVSRIACPVLLVRGRDEVRALGEVSSAFDLLVTADSPHCQRHLLPNRQY